MRIAGDASLWLWKVVMALSLMVEDGEELEERRRKLSLALLYIGAGHCYAPQARACRPHRRHRRGDGEVASHVSPEPPVGGSVATWDAENERKERKGNNNNNKR